uniref:Putative secreted protein n=1 Tax=Anopheles marajoara TaxID=58244 RepID=A0A2M4CCP0_9DIPT
MVRRMWIRTVRASSVVSVWWARTRAVRRWTRSITSPASPASSVRSICRANRSIRSMESRTARKTILTRSRSVPSV